MTRPQIIRAGTEHAAFARTELTPADTIDLQDKSSPTAKDHSQQPEHPAPLGIGPAAPHQQAAIRRVEEERTSEEVKLHDAWGSAGSALQEDPGSDDDRTVENADGKRHDEQAVRLNGGIDGDGDDADLHDADAEEDMDDDDDMDKISSSPSIDDGGYSLPLQPPTWPARRESLTPQSSPLHSVASSSPFTTTPIHFPISVASARRPHGVPARDASPIFESPTRSSIPVTYRFSYSSQSTEHHRGEYAWTRTARAPEDGFADELDTTMSPRSKQRNVVERRLQIMREDSLGSLTSDSDEEAASSMLRPIGFTTETADDPFREPIAPAPAPSPAPRRMTNTPPPRARHPDEEEESWTTDSDADSWDEDLHSDDDASNDVSFSNDSRFIDSGWGGECLRETEDIDFEFVYALHTFVATVEGQANATKGDTMVLLDDSNSYWWLVRVVKDSSIGAWHVSCCWSLLIRARLPTCRTHRDPDRTTSALEQAQKH
jgi:hypothetical protein